MNGRWVEMRIARIVIREDSDRQFIYVTEREGTRGFPIVIGTTEALEIHRVVRGLASERPLTHQLAHTLLTELGGKLVACHIVDLKANTFYATLRVETVNGEQVEVDSRPSDGIAIALRAGADLYVEETVLAQVGVEDSGPEAPSEEA